MAEKEEPETIVSDNSLLFMGWFVVLLMVLYHMDSKIDRIEEKCDQIFQQNIKEERQNASGGQRSGFQPNRSTVVYTQY